MIQVSQGGLKETTIQQFILVRPNLSQSHGGQQARRAAGDSHRQECGVHGANVGGPAGKQVVGVEVEQHDDAEGALPRQPVA